MTVSRPRGLEILAAVEGIPSHEAQRLLLAATGWESAALQAGRKLDAEQIARFEASVLRRRAGEPLQYIEGTCDFGPLTIRCDDRALIPRPETEQLWELVVAEVSAPPAIVVDVGTGSGVLALACKHAWPDAEVFATEISDDALALAAENVVLTEIDVTLLRGDVLEPLPERLRGAVDVIVSNPPYVAARELADLPSEVREYEPAQALVAGATGLEVLTRIAADASTWLRPGGMVACEISEFHGREAAARFGAFGGDIRQDLTGRDRFIVGRMTPTGVG